VPQSFCQLFAVNGFHKECIRAAGLSIGRIGLAVEGGNDDDGELLCSLVGAYTAACFESVDPGHNQIEEDQVRDIFLDLVERLLAVRGGGEIVAGVGDMPLENRRDAFLIVNNEDLLAPLGNHRKTSLVGGSGRTKLQKNGMNDNSSGEERISRG